MPELKLKDFVDEQSLNDLINLDNTIVKVHADFESAAKELLKGLKIDVEVKGDLDRLKSIYETQSQKAVSASDTLKQALEKQAKVVDELSRKIQEKASSDKISAKEAKELASATASTTAAVEKAAKVEVALNRERTKSKASGKSSNLTEEERLRIIREAVELSDKEIHSIDEANSANKRLREAVKLLKDTDEDYNRTLGKLNSTIGVNTDYVKKNSDRYTQQKMTVGGYREEIKNAWMELNRMNDSMSSLGIVSGQFGESLERIGRLKGLFSSEGIGGISSLVKNRWILGLGAAAGAGAGIGWWVNYNNGLVKATRLTQQFTQKSGDDLKRYRSEVQALADYYEKDFREMMIGVNSLTKQFGIGYYEALDLVKDGFIAGADANGEFLDTLREYPAYFKEAGISAEAFIAITAQAAKQGIYSDKGVDVIKEGNLRIREMTDATKDALEGIGISADEVQEQLKAGQKTTFDIIQMVSQRLDELPDSSAAVGTALADIFGGPGEDAGLQYIRTLKDIKTNLSEVKSESGKLGEAQEAMIESQKELSRELALLFDSTGGFYENMVARIKSSIASMTADIVSYVRRTFESVESLSNRQQSEARSQGEKYALQDINGQYEQINAARKKYVEQGMSDEEAFRKAKEERIEVIKRVIDNEKEQLEESVKLNKKYNTELELASMWRQSLGLDRSRDKINDDINRTWQDVLVGERSYSYNNKLLGLIQSYQYPTNKKVSSVVTDEEKKKQTELAQSIEDARIAVMEAGYEKEVETIRSGFERRISAIEGNSAKEIELRNALAAQMEKEIADYTESYEKERHDTDLKNRLAAAEKGSREEMDIRLEILEREHSEERKSAEVKGADIAAVDTKYLKMRQKIYEEYASSMADSIAEGAATEQVIRNAKYNSELRELKMALAEKKITQEEFDSRSGILTENFGIESAKASIDALERQLEVENLSVDERKKLSEELQKVREELADREADAEIAAIERIEKADEESKRKRMQNAQQWLQVSSDAIGQIGSLVNARYESQIQNIEDEQEARQEQYDKEIERIELLAENGVITEEEAEARKREAKDRSQRQEDELEAKAARLKYKQAVWDKSVQIAQAGIATALAIAKALPNLVLAALVGTMGAVQVATIAATPIPAYREGTRNPHPGGLALVGDGGTSEVVLLDGHAWVTPDTPTLIDLPEGSEVFPDMNRFLFEMIHSGKGPDDSGNNIIITGNRNLEKKIDRTNELLTKVIRVQRKTSYDIQYELFKKNRL
jgi:hypothetical protein